MTQGFHSYRVTERIGSMCSNKNLYMTVQSITAHNSPKVGMTSNDLKWWTDRWTVSVPSVEYHSAMKRRDVPIRSHRGRPLKTSCSVKEARHKRPHVAGSRWYPEAHSDSEQQPPSPDPSTHASVQKPPTAPSAPPLLPPDKHFPACLSLGHKSLLCPRPGPSYPPPTQQSILFLLWTLDNPS